MTEAELTLIRSLTDLLQKTIALLRDQQVQVLTIEKYLSEQPGYDAARFGVIFEEFSTDPTRMAKDLQKAQDALAAWLRDFEGPKH